ncbi:hypothetical protein [Prosthecochloris vibrioformis]|nr:hypothetical protein [Prosthecochloris vibrioformis]
MKRPDKALYRAAIPLRSIAGIGDNYYITLFSNRRSLFSYVL